MQVSSDQLLIFIGQLFVEKEMLTKQIDLQTDAVRRHMDQEHAPEPQPEVKEE
jgi:hypothetical protein